MPTYDQLDNEAAWRAEFAAPAIAQLADRLRRHWPGASVGIRGDNKHLRGYHRSRRWILESFYCTDRSYSVSRTAGDRSGGDPNWACGLDLGGIPQSELHAACKRLDAAVRAGRLEKITEWYGNFGNDDRVDGWDNIANRVASADSSHLTHLHLGFDRGRANEDHSDLLAILTGGLTVATAEDVRAVWQYHLAPAGYNMQDHLLNAERAAFDARDELRAFVAVEATRDAATAAALSAITEAIRAGGGSIEIAPVLERITAEATLTRMHVEERHQAEMRALEELHRTQLAEKAAELAGLQAELDALKAAAGS